MSDNSVDQYDYDLPDRLIAQFPLENRIDARLMIVNRQQQTIEHSHIRDIVQWLDPRDSLVINNTRVIAARLTGYREATKGRWSGLFVRAEEQESAAEHEKPQSTWLVMSKTRGKLEPGEAIVLQDRESRERFRLRMIAKSDNGLWVARPEPNLTPMELLPQVGHTPIPPYIRGGQMVDSDISRYQTVYAKEDGAIAAPTAGLHFTESLLNQIRGHGCGIAECTLHVGVGTFKPITAEQVDYHQMHSEHGVVPDNVVEQLSHCRGKGGRIVAVGTTVVRSLESASTSGQLQSWSGSTDLFIRPPYEFHSVDALLTNFHLPKSTLLILVRTFGGDELMRHAYQAAIDEGYRFFSYGDAMLIV